MEDNIQIIPVDPITFELQDYSTQDTNIISKFEIDTVFSQSTDYIEYYVYDENQNLIFPPSTQELLAYNVKNGDVLFSPDQDLQKLGFDSGAYFIAYSFYRKRLASSLNAQYYISSISSDRTELRLNSSQILKDDIILSTNEFIEYRNSSNYFVDFYLNFGDNNLIIANNIRLDLTDPTSPQILIKLYEPLPFEFDLKSLLWVVESISTPQTYQVIFPIITFTSQDFTYISGPNFDLNAKGEIGSTSQNLFLNSILENNSTSSYNQLQSLLNNKGIKINVDYENFNEFIHFSSLQTRLENFYYKVNLIEESTQLIQELESIGSNTTSVESTIQNIITNFDGYEYFLYYNSGSAYSWPKNTSSPPYTLYPSDSPEVLSWIGSADPANSYYGGLALEAYEFDQNNQDRLYWAIPEYLRDDNENAQYLLFIDMIGQHFDNIWIYTKDITNKFSADNRLDYGISKDLVADAIKDFGIKLYSNNFSISDLYTSFLGVTPSGSLFPYPNQSDVNPTPSGYEFIDTLISSSNNIIPLDDANKRLYKRIYHNIPYLLKTKGTIAGLRALITSYGIPDTILSINEFGGNIINSLDDRNLKQRTFNYAFDTQNQNYFSSSFTPNTDFDNGKPNTIQFRFKTDGLPTQASQSLWSIDNGNVSLVLEYTGSGLISSSYSGSIPDPYNEYGTLKFIPDSTNPSISASLYLPFFDGGWWSIITTQDNLTASLHAANSINNTLGFNSVNSVTGYDNTEYNSGLEILFPNSTPITYESNVYSPFLGLLQEIRYYSSSLNTSSFYDYVLNPYSSEGNGVNSSPNDLIFRADLGSLSSLQNRESIHPKSSGPDVYITSSFLSDNTFYLSDGSFVVNTEIINQNQLISGIKDRVTDKIQLKNLTLAESPSGSNDSLIVLSPLRSIQQSNKESGSFSEDINYLEVAFSPQDQINNDIISQLGNFNLGEYIGDPRQFSSPSVTYPDLDKLRNEYFEKYIHSYDVKDFIRLIKFFDNSLFRMIKDFTPARTSLSSGVVVKQHILERNRVRPAQLSTSDELLEGTIKPFSRGYSTGSGDTGQYEYISGSSIYTYKGGTGGTFEQFNGLDFHPNTVDNRFDVTQSWEEEFSTTSGSVIYKRDDQREFYNGEFSGTSPYVKLQRGLGDSGDPCAPYLKINPNDFYVYNLEFFKGFDSRFIITSSSIATTTTTSTTTTSTTTTSTTSTTTTPPVHNFSSTPAPGGNLGAIRILGNPPGGISFTGSPFSFDPQSISSPITSSIVNFTNGSFTTNETISFRINNSLVAIGVFCDMKIMDNLTNTYEGSPSVGPLGYVISFNLGTPSGRTFSFLGGEVRVQFST